MAKQWLGERKMARLQGHDEDFYLPKKRPPQEKALGERKMEVLRKRQQQTSQPQQTNYPQPTQAGGSQIPGAPPIQQDPNLPYGYMYSDGAGGANIQYVTDPKTGLSFKVKPGMVVRNPAIPYGTQAPQVEAANQPASFATIEDARAGKSNWTDVSVKERKDLLSNPAFYKNNDITKYPGYIQQQILADPALDWSQLPKWQQTYFKFSSSPAAMGAVQGGAMGLIGGPVGGVAGAALGAGLGYAAGKSGYDITKEAWQQDTNIAKAFGYLNWLAEQAEKGFGAGIQAYASVTAPKEYGTLTQLWQDREAAWNAGAVTFERLIPTMVQVTLATPEAMLEFIKGLPEGKIAVTQEYMDAVMKPKEYYLGASDPVQMDEDFIRNIYSARERIKKGEDYRAVMMELQMGVTAQLGDMAGQIVLDPSYILPRVETKIGAKIADVSGNKVAAEALKQAGGLNEAARKYKTLVQTGIAKTIDPQFQVDKLGLFSRMVAGVNKAGEVKAGSLIWSDKGLLAPVKDKTGFLRSMVEQTAPSRAETGANMFYENVSAWLTTMDDPHDTSKYLKSLSNSDMQTWAEQGTRFAESPEFYTVLPALKEFNTSTLDGIVAQWDLATVNRDAMLRIANLLGQEPGKWLDDTAKRGTFEQDFQRLREVTGRDNSADARTLKSDIDAGRITAETLRQITDLFTGEGALSWHPGQWKAMMLNALGDHFDKWVTKRLMLDKSPEAVSAFYRTTALMKQAQSILLLGGSPGYAITNGLSNMVHRAVTGIYGYMMPSQINKFLDRMGITPARMEEGVGIGGQVEQTVGKSQVKTEAITEAVRGRGALTTAKDNLAKISRGMPFSKLSSWFEKTEGRQGFAIAMKQFWSQSWRRGVGFSRMSPELAAEIRASGINPEYFYGILEGSMNQGEIQSALLERRKGIQARELVHDAAQKAGISASQAAEMMDKIGLLDGLDTYLEGRTTPDGIRAAFKRAEETALNWIDMQTGEDLKAIAESVKQRTGLEGATAALDVAQKASSTYFDAWLDHYSRFGEVMTDLKLLDDPEMRSKAIDYNYQISDNEFRRLNARHAANYKGLFEAWGLSGNEHALNVLAAIGEMDEAMSTPYRRMRELRRNFFDTYRNDWDNPKKWDDWDADSRTIEELFKQGFADKHTAEVKMGRSLAEIYEGMHGPAAGEAALKWWQDVTAFNDEIVKREREFRKRLEGLNKDQRDIAKQKYYSETKVLLISEADRINGEGIARLERVIKKGGGGGSPSPEPSPMGPLNPTDETPSPQPSPEGRGGIDELNALMAAAEQRKGIEAKQNAERASAIWDVAEEYWGRGRNYSRGILQDKFALMAALKKQEYGGIPDLVSLSDPRLTPEIARAVMEARKAAKEMQALDAAEKVIKTAKPSKKHSKDTLNAAEKAYIDSFNMESIPEVPFDEPLWQTEFSAAVQRGDLDKLWGLIGEVPDNFDKGALAGLVKTVDETALRVEKAAREFEVRQNLARAEAVIAEAETRAEAVTTRQMLKEKFQEVFGEEKAQAYMELSDAVIGHFAKITGESADALYARYYQDVVRGSGQGTVDGGRLEQANAGRIWYSKLIQTVEGITQPKMTVDQLRGALTKAGVKADEIKWMGLEEWMAGRKNVTKADALEFLQENQVQVEEVTKGVSTYASGDLAEIGNLEVGEARGFLDAAEKARLAELRAKGTHPTKFGQYTLPGGTSYREVLFKLPSETGTYETYQHWDEPNVLAHVRLDDRVDVDGKKVLFVEEVQSDWHQAGRERGYSKEVVYRAVEEGTETRAFGGRDFDTHEEAMAYVRETLDDLRRRREDWGRIESQYEVKPYSVGVPPSPFSKTWHEMVMKRVLRMAAEGGYDRVAWTTGEQQAARYDLAKQVDSIRSYTDGNGKYDIAVNKDDTVIIEKLGLTPNELSDTVGKDLANKIVNAEVNTTHEWSGENLKVGGEGMKGFYDKILPAYMDKYGKKWGAKVGETQIITVPEFAYGTPGGDRGFWKPAGKPATETVHSIDVTPAMKQSVMQGQPLFQNDQQAGQVQNTKGAVTFDAEGIKATIHAFEAADFSTLIHENGHVFRRMLADVAERTGDAQVKADLATIEDWAGVKNGKWEKAHEEKFARGFERYLAEGKAPTPALARAFESFKRWMLEIYKTITGSEIDVKITDEVRGVLDRMMGEEASKPVREPSKVKGQKSKFVQAKPTIMNVSEYPAKEYTFTGEWDRQTLYSQKGSKVAARNRPTVWYPIYESADGQRILDATQMSKVDPNPTLPSPNAKAQGGTLFQEADQPFGAYDAASKFHPQSEVMDQGWREHIRPLLGAMEEVAVQRAGDLGVAPGGAMSPEGQAMLKKYMQKVQGEMASTKLATVRWGENQRDFALLNYNKRYGLDKVAEALYPYQFYYTRSFMNWAARALDKPALYSNYARLKIQQQRYENDMPERLRGKIKISAPWLPEWMGGNLYIDPLSNLFFPAQVLKPFERAQQDKNYQVIETERILQEWSEDGIYSDSDVAQAAEMRSGTVWERALAEAQIRRESEIASPFDFFSTMFGPAWYLSTPLSLAGIKVFPNQGEPGKVNTTPLYNTLRGVDTVTQGTWAEPIGNLIGAMGKPVEWLRKKLELPEFGEYGDYYIDRQLANMVAEGRIDSEQAQIAMIERQGKFFDEARERVKLEVALRVPTMGALYAGLHEGAGAGTRAFLPSLFGAGLLPAGELEYRGLKQEWNEAWKRADGGDKDAVNKFFDDHPEYEAYLAKNKEPEERLKSFLIGQIWDGYMALGTTNRKQASAEMGNLFQQSFLDTETRSYDTLDIETLTSWARMLNKKTPNPTPLPASQTSPQIQNPSADLGGRELNLYDPSVTVVTDEYFRQRTEKFPNFYEEQTGYYALPKSERTTYLLKTPGLKEYLDWKDGWYKKYPSYVPVFNGQVFKQVDTSGWPPGLEDYVIAYAYTGKRLPSGAYKALEQQWIMAGKPYDNLQSWLDAAVAPAMLYGSGE